MCKNKAIFFDCMETLIDMYELPGDTGYALWAYEGSGVEKYWKDSEEFVEQHFFMRKFLKERPPLYREYSINERFQMIVERKLGSKEEKLVSDITEKLIANFWVKYKNQCYVSQEVIDTLDSLSHKGYKMGVVSNFLVMGGVEELLTLLGLAKYFQFVVTSVEEGWRKPHSAIYERALFEAQAEPKEVIFIGDDYERDYLAPHRLGMKSFLYDRRALYPQANRFASFKALQHLL